jgi:UV DNA damage repair endonuclease
MKMDDMNIIIGQQQLESLDMVINILKNKNKEDKIETIKKSNIQKSVAWCEKYKIPCNRFSEKINIFLPINKEVKEAIEFIDI